MKLRTKNRSIFGGNIQPGSKAYPVSAEGEVDVPLADAITLLRGGWKKAPDEPGAAALVAPKIAPAPAPEPEPPKAPKARRRRSQKPAPESLPEKKPTEPAPAPVPTEVDLGLGEEAPKRGFVDRLFGREADDAGETGSEE